MRAAPAVLAILIVGVGSLAAGYRLGKEDSPPPRNRFDRPFSEGGVTKHEYTLRDGDVVFRLEAGVRCLGSREGRYANLFCTHIGGGRHQIALDSEKVLVRPLDCPACGPDGPVYTYHWAETLK